MEKTICVCDRCGYTFDKTDLLVERYESSKKSNRNSDEKLYNVRIEGYKCPNLQLCKRCLDGLTTRLDNYLYQA